MMKYDFWKDVQRGDILFYYDMSNLTIKEFTVLNVRDKSDYTGSFFIDTDITEHSEIYVFVDNFKYECVLTWDGKDCEKIFISNIKADLIEDCKKHLGCIISQLKSDLEHYNNLLENLNNDSQY